MNAETTPNSKRHLNIILALACLAQFMVVLDVSVVNVALPAIRGALHFSEQDLQWVVNAYTVTFAGFLLLGGRAADLLGRRRVFASGLVLFALASLAGGIATSQTLLIAARAAQGLGGAIVAPASLSILTTTFEEGAARNRAVGIWGAMGGAGGAAGVLLGGVLTDLLSWRWILFINIPIGLLAATFALRYIPETREAVRRRSFDLAGAITATVGLSVLVLGIVRTDVTGWGSASTLGLLISGAALLALFVTIEGRIARSPLMPLRIYASRTLSAANIVVLMIGAAVFAMWFFLSLYLQQVLGYSPLRPVSPSFR
jgi:EmrB/QacA subfamily drug resistance transporter